MIIIWFGVNITLRQCLVSNRVGFLGRGRKTWGEHVKDDMKLLGLQPEWAIFREM